MKCFLYVLIYIFCVFESLNEWVIMAFQLHIFALCRTNCASTCFGIEKCFKMDLFSYLCLFYYYVWKWKLCINCWNCGIVIMAEEKASNMETTARSIIVHRHTFINLVLRWKAIIFDKMWRNLCHYSVIRRNRHIN